MTEQAENRNALSSTDGRVWTDIKGEEANAEEVEGTVTRVVIGELGEDKDIQHGSRLLEEALARHGQTITHLHLWNLKNLDHLEHLPPNLECLDLRGCSTLTRIPELPETLETLDLESCEGLQDLPGGNTPDLKYLHLDNCRGLKPSAINIKIGTCPQLEELTLSNCIQLQELGNLVNLATGENPPFRKLVLQGCIKLRELPDLSVFKLLNHLNLNGCSSLEKLPRLPILEDPDPPRKYNEPVLGLRYLVAQGCDSLRDYRGLDLRPVHLSDHGDDNIIDTFRALEHLGQPPAELLSSKLLLLGSGRVGKTTLAKALLWADLDDDQRKTEEGNGKRPWIPSESTENIQFWPWRGSFRLKDEPQPRQGSVLIWDFAGQEYYHNTHRLFVASGAVFAIVVCDRDTHKARLEAEIARKKLVGTERDVFLEKNQYRPVSYWLDFVRSALGIGSNGMARLPVILVNSSSDSERYFLEQAGSYAEEIEKIPMYSLVCETEGYVSDLRFKQLKNGLEEKLGESADQLGIRVPRFYQVASQKIGELFSPNHSYPEKPFFKYPEWTVFLKQLLEEDRSSPAFAASVIRAVSKYLHRIGQVFWLDESADSAVIVDQQVGVQTIYTLCESSTHSSLLKSNSGLMAKHALKNILREAQNHLRDRVLSEDQLLQLLETCDICVPIDHDHWQALNPSLLPEPSTIQSDINTSWFSLIKSTAGFVNHCFRLTGKGRRLVGSADMQAAAAWLVRSIRAGGQGQGLPRWLAMGEQQPDHELKEIPIVWRAEWKFWRNGVQIAWHPEFSKEHRYSRMGRKRDFEHDESPSDPFLLRIQYAPFEVDGEDEISYDGSLYIELLTCDEARMSKRLKTALFADSGPLAFLRDSHEITDTRPEKHPESEVAYPRDAAMWPWKKARQPGSAPDRYDVAISVRGVDVDVARELYECLNAAGLNTYCYLEDEECRPRSKETESSLLEIYRYLDNAQRLVIVCSSDYLEMIETTPEAGNLFCPVELAAAVSSMHRPKNQRQHSDIVILVIEDNKFKRTQLSDLVVRGLQWFYSEIVKKRDNFPKRMRKERDWVETALDHKKHFIDECTESNSQVIKWDRSENSKDDIISSVINKVQRPKSGH